MKYQRKLIQNYYDTYFVSNNCLFVIFSDIIMKIKVKYVNTVVYPAAIIPNLGMKIMFNSILTIALATVPIAINDVFLIKFSINW